MTHPDRFRVRQNAGSVSSGDILANPYQGTPTRFPTSDRRRAGLMALSRKCSKTGSVLCLSKWRSLIICFAGVGR
jgi:hypothetical protein